jgi:hypothetical protein
VECREKRGRNSAVECQLPKLDVVGSSPIARSIFGLRLRCDITNFFSFFSPVFSLKQNIFALVLAFSIFLSANPVEAQDFAQSDYVFLPATTDDLGALPYRIHLVQQADGLNSVQGLLSTQVGWTNDLGQGASGLGALPPGLLFEGIAYPLSNRDILNWIPAMGTMELLNFPAQAWWGPRASAGAVQFREPDLSGSRTGQYTAWGGTHGFGDFFGEYSDPDFSLSENYRHTPFTDFSDHNQQTFGLQAKVQLLNDDEWNLHGGFLGFQNWTGDNWYSWVGDFQWSDQNFQSIRLRPYFQTARAQNEQADEFGGHLDYDVNVAGIVEGNLAAGLSGLTSTGSVPAGGQNEGYLQDTEMIDALGDFTVNLAFRLDFLKAQSSYFSSLMGLQYNVGIMTFLADYATGLDPQSLDPSAVGEISIQQEDLGAKIHLETKDELDLIYVHQFNGQAVLNGGIAKFLKGFEILDGPVLEDAGLEADAQWLRSVFGQNFGDVGIGLNGLLFRSVKAVINVRTIASGPWYGTASLSYQVNPHFAVLVTGQNLGNNPVSWPESDFEPGFNLMAGITLGF